MTVGVVLLGIFTVASGLDLSSNDLTSVPPNLSSAETRLDLNNNRITILRKHDFFAMTNLKVLNLRFNQIETIEEGAFVGLSNLYALSLYSNKIKNIPDISSLANLKFFWVGANPLFITHGDFENMKSLHVLDISWIWSRVFTPLPYSPNMTSLNLGGNIIKQYSKYFFKSLPSLKKILLQKNLLSSFPEFGQCKEKITNLIMNRNRLYRLPDLRGYKSMVYLDLSQNYISALPEQSLSMLVSGTVKLDANPIPCVQELCWLATSNLSVEVTVTCQGGLSLQEMDIDVLCEGMSPW